MLARLLLTDAARDALERAVRDAWPDELVALLGGEGERVDAVLPLPDADATGDAFAVDAATFARAEGKLRDAGRAFVGFAHSHPGGSAALSAQDRAELWRGCAHVVAATDGRAVTLRGFWLDGDVTAPLPLLTEAAR